MAEALTELEKIQTRILQRITNLELSLETSYNNSSSATTNSSLSAATAADTTTEGRLSSILVANGVRDFSFKRVPSDYYDWPLEARRDVLGAASIHHLCKSIVLVPLLLLCFLDD